jgi:hypothetical protein
MRDSMGQGTAPPVIDETDVEHRQTKWVEMMQASKTVNREVQFDHQHEQGEHDREHTPEPGEPVESRFGQLSPP